MLYLYLVKKYNENKEDRKIICNNIFCVDINQTIKY